MTDFHDDPALAGNLRALLAQLLIDEGIFEADVTPDSLFLTTIDPEGGHITASVSLFDETYRSIIERQPPVYAPSYPFSGVFSQGETFDDAHRVHPSFEPIDFYCVVGKAYDRV
jgi:hypothetical protein